MVSSTTGKKKKCKCTCDRVHLLKKITGNPQPLPISDVNKIRLNLFTERNSDGTGYLVLQGRDMFERYTKRIGDLDVTAICKYVSEAPMRITKIDLRYNEITDNGFLKLLKRLLVKGRSSVTELNIMNNNLTFKSIEHLAKYAKLVKLKTLRINGNKLGSESGKFLMQLFMDNVTIECCDLGETGQTLSSLAQIVAGFRNDNNGNTTVRTLNLNRLVPLFNRYKYESKLLAYHIELLLERNTVITELRLQKNQLIAHDIEYLVRGLNNNKSLQNLDLGYNRIGDYGAEILAKYLSKNPPMLIINIAGNGINDIGARALSFSLPYSRIKALDVSRNGLSDCGVIDLLFTFRKKYVLTHLCIWGNGIGARSCEVLQRMLSSGTLKQDNVDVKIFEEDGRLSAAYYPADMKHSYYSFMEFGYAQPIYHIKRNSLSGTS